MSFRLALVTTLLGAAACHGLPRPGGPDRYSPSDARIAGAALLANNVEIHHAALAPSRASHPEVLAYAARMRTDHSSLNASLTDLLGRLGIAAEDDPSVAALRDSSVARRARLEKVSGRAFDIAYLDADAQSHRELLAVVDRLRAANPTSAELREYVAALRPAYLAHLAHAEQVRGTLAARRR